MVPPLSSGLYITARHNLDLWDLKKHLSQHISIGQDKQFLSVKLLIFFLPISFSICFGCSKEPSH